MTDIEKHLSKLINLTRIMHNENITIINLLRNLYGEEDRKAIDDYLKKTNATYESILSGIYEDDVTITH